MAPETRPFDGSCSTVYSTSWRSLRFRVSPGESPQPPRCQRANGKPRIGSSRAGCAAATPMSGTSVSSSAAKSSEAGSVYRMPRIGTHRGLSLDGNGHASPRAPHAPGNDPGAESATHPRQGSLGQPATDCLPEMSVGQTCYFSFSLPRTDISGRAICWCHRLAFSESPHEYVLPLSRRSTISMAMSSSRMRRAEFTG